MNPLRVLDDKRESVQAQLTDAPLMVNHLCDACTRHYDSVREYLRIMNVAWVEAPRMVRGLDYYTRTTFEFTHHLLGAQSGIGGGGRYDGLMASVGGDDLSGIGFGLGTDRTLLACEAEGLTPGSEPHLDAFLVPIGAAAKSKLVSLSAQLRAAGVRIDLAYGDRGLKGAMKAADRSGAPLVVVVGDAEVEADIAQVKTMSTGDQATVAWPDLITFISSAIERDLT
jgi:histidyl-tRNA synthetase